MSKTPFFFLFGMCLFLAAIAQGQSMDTSFARAAIQQRIQRYAQSIGGQAQLYTGSQYKEQSRTGDDHPYFLSEDWTFGYVVYDHERYHEVPLILDITGEHLITEHPYSGDQIVLVNERLTEFALGSHRFVKLRTEDFKNSLPRTGFYEIIYPGTTTFICLRQKNRRETIESHEIEIYFDEKDRYFLLQNGSFIPVRNKKSVLTLLKDEKTALRQFLKRNKLNFRIQREEALKQVATYYDSLKKTK